MKPDDEPKTTGMYSGIQKFFDIYASGLRIVSLGRDTAYLAGSKWKKHRDTSGKRIRVLADFLIGA